MFAVVAVFIFSAEKSVDEMTFITDLAMDMKSLREISFSVRFHSKNLYHIYNTIRLAVLYILHASFIK